MQNDMDKYHRLFEDSVVGMWWATFEDGVVLEANPAMRRLFGVDSFEGIRARDFYVRSEDRERVKEQLRRTGVVRDLEILYKRKDGSQFWGSHSAWLYADQGIIEGIMIDVSHRRWAEDALRRSEAKYKTLFNCANDAIFIIRNGEVIDCNLQTLKMFGCRLEEILAAQSPIRFSPPLQPNGKNTKAKFFEKIEKALSGEPQSFEWKHYRHDGAPFDAEVSLNRIELDGEALIQAIVRDITERKQAEESIRKANEDLRHRSAELEVLNKELEAFSYSVSHDLRAPLRAIDGFSQAILEDYHDQVDEEGQDFLRRIQAASRHMARLIDDILLLSRISRAELRHGAVKLSALASAVAAELQKASGKQQVDFIAAPGIEVKGDPNLLRIVMENLLNNAYKFMGNKSGTIEFGMIVQDEKPVYFVRDTGVGFDMAYANKLFAPFQRLHREDEFEGIGIGLATVQRVIHRHGGHIWAEGEVGKGATFYFTLRMEME
ncbi:sensor histidine kinase [Syntrophorhabdus aromaticivorans]|uniref:histidine kinase n=1 Tax=Syntrophorhabdus aromaticivorans TaxID=328301 RepID=A0A351U6Y3_9BACT|nr:PAS domain S-box protein [Syntrophorhabdus aromaticivorans]NLW36694.1 PAS domain S-box protein [Syntrophorhabdus aromaticivorans]HBA55714.1 PAS domain-containing sensor histidine kinase [Syntrophorhabdus aromaticivorans]